MIRIRGKPRLVMLAVALILVMTIVRLAAAGNPYFTPNITNVMFNLTQGQEFYFKVNATDPDSLNFTFLYFAFMNSTAHDKPWNTFKIDNSTGVMNFTPSNGDVTYPYGLESRRQVELQVIDTSSNVGIAWLYFNISNVNDPPNITFYEPTPTTFSMNESDSRNFTFNYDASDPDIPYGDYLNQTWYLSGGLGGILYNGTPYSFNKSWRFNPGYCDAGIKNITLLVNDSYGNYSKVEWNVTVIDVNRPPVFSWDNPIQNITWDEEESLINNISLDVYFSDPDNECGGNNASFSVSGNHNITVVISNGTGHNVSFIPNDYWFGEETINFTMSDGHDTATSNNIVLNVSFVSIPPVIQNISDKTAYAFGPFYFKVNATSPNHIPLTYYDNTSLFDIDPSTGRISFTPDDTEIGNFSIMINVSDGTYNVFTTFNLQIINNSRPVILPIGNQTAVKGTEYDLTIDGYDAEGDSISFVTDYLPMAVPYWQNSTSAKFRFTPHQADLGNHTILVNATDSRGASSSTTFNLEVQNVHLPPTFNQTLSTVIVKINHTVSIQLNASSEDGYSLNFTHNASAATFPDFSMTEDGLISIPANDSDQGNHTVRLNVSDITEFPLSSVMDVLFVVTPNRNPVIYPVGMQSVIQNNSFTLKINASDLDGDPLTFFTNSSFNFSSDGVFSFTPNQSMVGLYNISVNVTDNDGGWGFMSFMLNISNLNEPPYFEPPLQDYPIWSNIYNDQPVEIYVNATDPDDDDLAFGSTFTSGPTLFSIVKTGRNRALINFTANKSQIGNYSVNITVSDYQFTTHVVINFSVGKVNYPPYIMMIYPYGMPLSSITVLGWANKSQFPDNVTYINASEGSMLLFNHTNYEGDSAYFSDAEDLSHRWYLDDELVSTQESWDYSIGFDAQGMHNVTLMINDSGYYDSMMWVLNVTNKKRPPVFGEKIFSEPADFLGGVASLVNISNAGLTLAEGNGSYYGVGTYTSDVIDMGLRLVYGDVEWVADIPDGTNISIATSSSDYPSSGWSDWSYAENTSGVNSSRIASPNKRYLRYTVGLATNSTSKTPDVSKVVVNYVIDNLTTIERYYTIENGTEPWISLGDFFTDPDNEDLNYSFIGEGDSSVVKIWIESWNGNRVGVRSNKYGVYYVTFTATDPEGNSVSSNKVKLTFTHNPTQDQSNTGNSGTSTTVRTITQQVPTEVDKYINLDIIVPEAMTTYQNSTIVSPIKLVNTGDKPLTGIDLTAATNISGVDLEFTKTHFDSLAVGESVRTNLVITSPEFLGSYEITVKADVKDPVFSDSAKIMLNTLEKGELNRTQLNTKITFTRDLLLSNPECLELNELLSQAEQEVNRSNYVRANELIEDTIRYCRYLVASKDTMMEKPGLLESLYLSVFSLTSKRQLLIFGSAIVAVFVLLTASLMIEKARVKKEIRNKRERLKQQ